jgi:hypothetical protein
VQRSPERKGTDLNFWYLPEPNSEWLYDDFGKIFSKTLYQISKGTNEDGNERRRQSTFHSFRRFVKTTISELARSNMC